MKSNKLMTTAVLALGLAVTSAGVVMAVDGMMKSEGMMKSDGMMKSEGMMDKTMQKAGMNHEMPFSASAFAEAQASGQPFLIAFHKKGCPMCARQKEALQQVYADPQFKDLKVLVVDYDNDTASLRTFKVGMQATLILYKGDMEARRGDGLVTAKDIEMLVRG